MSKKSSSSANSGKAESYIIKVPVHLAFMYEEKDSLFFSNKLEMIQFVKDKIDNYKNPVKTKGPEIKQNNGYFRLLDMKKLR